MRCDPPENQVQELDQEHMETQRFVPSPRSVMPDKDEERLSNEAEVVRDAANEMDIETEERVERNVRRTQRVGKTRDMFTYDAFGEPSYRPWRAEAKALWSTQQYIPRENALYYQYMPTHPCCHWCHNGY